MEWSSAISRLETSIYLNYTSLEELLHTYDDLFGSKNTLLIDKTLGCLCNAITDILKKSSGSGREKIFKISSLKKIKSKLSDVKRWEIEATSSCYQLGMICHKQTIIKLKDALWKWKYLVLQARHYEQECDREHVDMVTIHSHNSNSNKGISRKHDDGDDSHDNNNNDDDANSDDDDYSDDHSGLPIDSYSNIHQSRNSIHLLPPFPMESEPIALIHSTESSINSERDFNNPSLTSLGHTPIESSLVDAHENLHHDDHNNSPDLSVDVSVDSVDQDLSLGPFNSPPIASNLNTSSYLASYLSSPLSQNIVDSISPEVIVHDPHDGNMPLFTADNHEPNSSQEIEEDEISIESLSQSNQNQSNHLNIHDTPPSASAQVYETNGTGSSLLTPSKSQPQPQLHSLPLSHTLEQISNDPSFSSAETNQQPVPSVIATSIPSNSAIEINWNEFSSSDEASSSQPSSEQNEQYEIDDDLPPSATMRESSAPENEDNSLNDEQLPTEPPKDFSEYSLNDVMTYLSLPLERTPLKSVQSTTTSSSSSSPSPSPSQSLSPSTASSIDRKPPSNPPSLPPSQSQSHPLALETDSKKVTTTPTQNSSRRNSVSSTSVTTSKQSIPPPPPSSHSSSHPPHSSHSSAPAGVDRRGSTNSLPKTNSSKETFQHRSQSRKDPNT